MTSERSKRLTSSISISDCPSEIFCTQFSPNDELLAAGCGDGSIKVFNSKDGKMLYSLNEGENRNGFDLPCTSLRFRPSISSGKTKNVLLAANSNGTLQHWHVTSGKCISTIIAEENQFFTLEYNYDGTSFAAAGKDHAVYVYDEQTKNETLRMKGGIGTLFSGHSNRIFSLKYHPKDPQLIMSGGWDNTVHIWDIRSGKSIRSFYGPHIAGDALDTDDNNQILTGSWRAEDPLELWDFNTGKQICVIPWDQSHIQGPSCFLYSACYSPDSSLIAAGGSGSNKVKVFDHKKQNRLVGTVAGIQRGVFTLAFSSDGDRLAIGGADSALRIIDVNDFNPASTEFVLSPSRKSQQLTTESNISFDMPEKSEVVFPPSPIKLS